MTTHRVVIEVEVPEKYVGTQVDAFIEGAIVGLVSQVSGSANPHSERRHYRAWEEGWQSLGAARYVPTKEKCDE